MSEDRSAPVAVKAGDPIFLSVKAGMTVIVRHLPEVGLTSDDDRWWMTSSETSIGFDLTVHMFANRN